VWGVNISTSRTSVPYQGDQHQQYGLQATSRVRHPRLGMETNPNQANGITGVEIGYQTLDMRHHSAW
jgi:hypothetical protein